MVAMDIMSIGMFALAAWVLKLFDLRLMRALAGLTAYYASTVFADHGAFRPWLDSLFSVQP